MAKVVVVCVSTCVVVVVLEFVVVSHVVAGFVVVAVGTPVQVVVGFVVVVAVCSVAVVTKVLVRDIFRESSRNMLDNVDTCTSTLIRWVT